MHDVALHRPEQTIEAGYRHLVATGFTDSEAASVIALAAGIRRPGGRGGPTVLTWGWTEIAHLLFVRYLAESGRLPP
jgi:hypothetical protein